MRRESRHALRQPAQIFVIRRESWATMTGQSGEEMRDKPVKR
jgi:hypothetical protein